MIKHKRLLVSVCSFAVCAAILVPCVLSASTLGEETANDKKAVVTAGETATPGPEATKNPATVPSEEVKDGDKATIDSSAAEDAAVTITKKKASIKAGKTFRFKAESSDGETVTWSVNKKDIATISKKGLFKAKKVGKVTVTAKTESAKAKVKVKVLPKKTVAIDAGHQARANSGLEPIGPGASTKKPKVSSGTAGVYTKVPEYVLTLAVAKRLQKHLVERGYKVVMIRTTNDVNISNSERAKKANESSDICIRLHADAAAASASGASALYPSSSNKYCGKISKNSKKLSEKVMACMCQKSGAKNRGLFVRNDLTGTNWSKIPVTLIEMGFMTNKAEDIKMQQPDYQEKLAEGMADGIDEYFGF